MHPAGKRKVDVVHPEFALVFPNLRHVLVISPIDQDTSETIDVSLIVSLTPIPAAGGDSQAA